jgi:hypothetical protein
MHLTDVTSNKIKNKQSATNPSSTVPGLTLSSYIGQGSGLSVEDISFLRSGAFFFLFKKTRLQVFNFFFIDELPTRHRVL